MKLKFWNTDKTPVKQGDETFFYPMGAPASYASGSELSDQARLMYFLMVPELNTVLNLRARATSNARLIIVDKDTENDITEKVKGDPYFRMLKEPNYFQSQQEFFSQTCLFGDIFGNEFIYPNLPFGMKDPVGIFSLPSQNVVIENSGEKLKPFFLYDKLPDTVKYRYTDENGQKKELDTNILVHLNSNNVKFTNQTDFLKGLSKIDPLQAPLSNTIAAYEARNVLIVNRGAIGILSNASRDGIGSAAPLDVKEKDRLHQEFRKYGLTRNQWQVIITNLALTWQQMAVDVDKLKLFDETREDTLKICDQYGTPFELLSAYKNTTFDNKREAQRQWYRDTIIPESVQRLAAMNRQWLKDKNYRIQAKFDHLPIFEEERKDKARGLLLTVNALSRSLEDGVITIAEYRKELKNFGI